MLNKKYIMSEDDYFECCVQLQQAEQLLQIVAESLLIKSDPDMLKIKQSFYKKYKEEVEDYLIEIDKYIQSIRR